MLIIPTVAAIITFIKAIVMDRIEPFQMNFFFSSFNLSNILTLSLMQMIPVTTAIATNVIPRDSKNRGTVSWSRILGD